MLKKLHNLNLYGKKRLINVAGQAKHHGFKLWKSVGPVLQVFLSHLFACFGKKNVFLTNTLRPKTGFKDLKKIDERSVRKLFLTQCANC